MDDVDGRAVPCVDRGAGPKEVGPAQPDPGLLSHLTEGLVEGRRIFEEPGDARPPSPERPYPAGSTQDQDATVGTLEERGDDFLFAGAFETDEPRASVQLGLLSRAEEVPVDPPDRGNVAAGPRHRRVAFDEVADRAGGGRRGLRPRRRREGKDDRAAATPYGRVAERIDLDEPPRLSGHEWQALDSHGTPRKGPFFRLRGGPRSPNAIYPLSVVQDVRLGAFTVADVDPAEPAARPDRAGEVVRLGEAAERAGLSSFWVAEHHFDGGGGCPSPPVLLAALGSRTSRIRLGSLVSVLPFHRPVDVAEEYALLDRLVGGRLNFGVGSGYLASEFAGFGVDAATKRERFESAWATIRAALAGEEFEAAPGAPRKVRLSVLPVQRPGPPVWVAVQRREALPYVAARGLGAALIPYATVADLSELRAEIEEYRRALPSGAHGSVLAAVHVYAGPETERGRAAFRAYLDSRRRTHSTFFEQKSHRAPETATPEALERAGLAVFGSPQEALARLGAFRDAGVDELLGLFDFGGLPLEDAVASLERLGAAWPKA